MLGVLILARENESYDHQKGAEVSFVSYLNLWSAARPQGSGCLLKARFKSLGRLFRQFLRGEVSGAELVPRLRLRLMRL